MDDLGGMAVDTAYSLTFWDPSIAQNWHNECQETLLVQQHVCDVGCQRHISGRRVQALLYMHRQAPLFIARSAVFGVSGQVNSSERVNISGVFCLDLFDRHKQTDMVGMSLRVWQEEGAV